MEHGKGAWHTVSQMHYPEISYRWRDNQLRGNRRGLFLRKIEVEVKRHPERNNLWRIENGLLYVYGQDDLLDPITNQEGGWKLVVPRVRQDRVLNDPHREASSGQLGIEKHSTEWQGSLLAGSVAQGLMLSTVFTE